LKADIKKGSSNEEYFFDEGCFITELWNDANDPTLSVARARVEPGKTTRWHLLQNTAERYVILQGSGLVEVEGLSAQVVSVDDVVLIPPEAKQRICNTGDDDLIFLALCSPGFTQSAYVDVDEEESA